MGLIRIKSKPDDKNKPCDNEKQQKRNYSQYYDTPDGCDVPTKIMVTTRYGMIAGLVLGTYDVMMYSHATGFGKIIYRYMVHTVPLGLMGATFAAVANTVQKQRMKDDGLNYFLGGFACGPIVGHYLGSKHAILIGGLALGVIGLIKKASVDKGWRLIPDVPPHMGKVNSWRHDWTLATDPKIEWDRIARCKAEAEERDI